MRILKFNNELVDIDNETAIGIDVQAFDIKQPSVSKINVSNTFTIPKTYNNLKIIGFAGEVFSMSNIAYDKIDVDYWIDNEQLIRKGRLSVEVGNRIECFIFEKDTIWDELKKYSYNDFVTDIYNWLDLNTEIDGLSYYNIIGKYAYASEGIVLPLTMGNFFNQLTPDKTEYLESKNKIRLHDNIDQRGVNGGHFFIYVKKIFQFLEYKYNINFYTSGGGYIGNIWDDQYISRVYTPFKYLSLYQDNTIQFTLFFNERFAPEKDLKYCDGKSVYDLIDSFFKHFNIIKSQVDNNIKLRRFDSIKDLGVVKDFSGNIKAIEKFSPKIDGIYQNNLIKFKAIYPEGFESYNAKTIICANENIDAQGTILEIDAYQPSFIEGVNGIIANMSVKESFKTFSWFLHDLTNYEPAVEVSTENYLVGYLSVTIPMRRANLYSLSSEYNFYAELILKPKYYEVKKWLSLVDIINIDFFNQFYIKELGASFIINKIKGFNPDKSTEATTLELILSSYLSPVTPPDADYIVDGQNDMIVDGKGDYFI